MKKQLGLISLLITALFLMGSKIVTDSLKIGRKVAENITIEFDIGSANNPKIVYNNSTSKIRFSHNGVAFFDLGSGSGGGFGVNFIPNSGFEEGVASVATYKDVAGSTPIDGVGGSPTAVTVTQNSTTPLRDAADMQFAKNATNGQGEGAGIAFTIKTQDINKNTNLNFDFNTTSASYAEGDVRVFVYDVTNSVLITPVNTIVPKSIGIFSTSFVATSSLSYRLIFHVATTNASAYTLYFDNVIAGQGQLPQGPVVSSAKQFTPTWDAGTMGASVKATEHRVGEFLFLDVSQELAGGGVAPLEFRLPFGLNVNTNHTSFSTSGLSSFGQATLYTGAGATKVNPTFGGTTDSIVFVEADGSAVLDSEVAAGYYLNFTLKVPILEWAGSGTVNAFSQDNLTDWQTYTPAVVQGFGTVSSAYYKYKRVGQSVLVKGGFTSGTPTATEARISLPPGCTSPSSPLIELVGAWTRNANEDADLQVYIEDSVNYMTFGKAGATQVGLVPRDGNIIVGAPGEIFNFKAEIECIEYVNNHNALVGFTEATTTNAGLVNAYNTAGTVFSTTYTPVGTTILNLDSVTPGKCQVTRVGKVFTFSCHVAVDPTALGDYEYELSLPGTIISNFTGSDDCAGSGASDFGDLAAIKIVSVAASDRIKAIGQAPSGSAQNTTIIGQCEIK